uniref:Uncharacterized protein n=1 Tax=Rhizophora mucronata TaxID=61149 RepID=A0A2P2JH65_RHIMU
MKCSYQFGIFIGINSVAGLFQGQKVWVVAPDSRHMECSYGHLLMDIGSASYDFPGFFNLMGMHVIGLPGSPGILDW